MVLVPSSEAKKIGIAGIKLHKNITKGLQSS